MPEMIVSPDSSSKRVRKVGSSFEKRCSAFDRFPSALRSSGLIDRWITASGTWIDVIATLRRFVVKVSPDAQSTPNSATMSPASAALMSSISSECMRTSRPTRTSLPVRGLKIVSPFFSEPW